MTSEPVAFPPPVPAPRVPDPPMRVHAAGQTRASLIANISVATGCLTILGMVAYYVLAGTP